MAWPDIDFIGEKGALIVAGILTAVISTGYGHVASQTHLFAALEPDDSRPGWTHVTIENVSITKAAEHHLIVVECVGSVNCLPPYRGRIDEIGTVDPVRPASMTHNQPCQGGGANFLAAVSLSVGQSVEIFVAAKPQEIDLRIQGKSPRPPCGTMNLVAVETQLLRDSSLWHTVKSSALRESTAIFNTVLAVLVVAFLYLLYQMFRRKPRVARKK